MRLLENQTVSLLRLAHPTIAPSNTEIIVKILKNIDNKIVISTTGEVFRLHIERSKKNVYIVTRIHENDEEPRLRPLDPLLQIRARNCYWLAWLSIYSDYPIVISWSFRDILLEVKCRTCNIHQTVNKMSESLVWFESFSGWSTQSQLLKEYELLNELQKAGCVHAEELLQHQIISMNPYQMFGHDSDEKVVNKYLSLLIDLL